MNPADHIVPGSLWYKQTVQGEVPPLVPPLPPDGSDWDASYISHTYRPPRSNLSVERRHSGWGAVEKKWAQTQPEKTSKREKSPPSKDFIETMSKLQPALSLPPPQLEADFRMKVTLNSNVATMVVGDGAKHWTTFTEGVWSGSLGTGAVVGGGQDSIDMEAGSSHGTHIESTFKLRTIDEPPAFIECKARGFRTGSEAIMKSLKNLEEAQTIDPRQYRHRILITMRTNDARYAEKVNFELWVGTCLWRGSEVIYDAYKIR